MQVVKHQHLGVVLGHCVAAVFGVRMGHHEEPQVASHLLASIPAPGHGSDSGLAWAEGSLWVGQYRDRKIHRIDSIMGDHLVSLITGADIIGATYGMATDANDYLYLLDGTRNRIIRFNPDLSAASAVVWP